MASNENTRCPAYGQAGQKPLPRSAAKPFSLGRAVGSRPSGKSGSHATCRHDSIEPVSSQGVDLKGQAYSPSRRSCLGHTSTFMSRSPGCQAPAHYYPGFSRSRTPPFSGPGLHRSLLLSPLRPLRPSPSSVTRETSTRPL